MLGVTDVVKVVTFGCEGKKVSDFLTSEEFNEVFRPNGNVFYLKSTKVRVIYLFQTKSYMFDIHGFKGAEELDYAIAIHRFVPKEGKMMRVEVIGPRAKVSFTMSHFNDASCEWQRKAICCGSIYLHPEENCRPIAYW